MKYLIQQSKSNPSSPRINELDLNNFIFRIKRQVTKKSYCSILNTSGLSLLDAERIFNQYKEHNHCSKEIPLKIELVDSLGRVVDYDFLPNQFTEK